MRIQSLHAPATLRNQHPSAWVRAGLSVALATVLIGTSPSATSAAPHAGPCFATANDGATVFDSADAKAVQDAVDAAGANGTVKVAGTCAGVQLRNGTNQTVFIDKALTLAGGYTLADWSTSNPLGNPTVLDALTNGRVIYATQPVTIAGLTVQNGVANKGGGAFFAGAATLIDAAFIGNTAINDSNGGGAWFDSTAVMTRATFTKNQADYVGGGAFFNTTAVIIGSTFAENTALKFHGGAAYIIGAAIVTGTSFLTNTAKLDAGGVLFLNTADVTGSTFRGNTSQTRQAGGAYFNGSAVLAGTTFDSNSADVDAGGAWFGKAATVMNASFIDNSTSSFGGGAFFGSTAHVSNTLFARNTSNNMSGGASFAGAAVLTHTHFISNSTLLQGGGASFGQPATLVGSRFISNTSKMYGGGGYFSAPATLIDTTFKGNRASDTGGGARFDDTLVMTDAIFIGNVSDLTLGGGFYLNRADEPSRITNSLFADNRAKNKGDAMYLFNPNVSGGTIDLRFVTIASNDVSAGTAIAVGKGTANLANTIITSHTVGIEQIDTAVVNEDHTLFFGNTANTAGTVNSAGGTVNADPAFRDPAGGNYRLQPGSPAIDAGIDLGVTNDLDSAPRPIFAGFDIGAYERGIVPAGLLVTATTTAPPLQPVTQLTATISAGTEPLVYTWDLGDGSPVVTGAVVSRVYGGGVYTATVTVGNPNGAISGTVQIPVPYRLLASIIVKQSTLPLVLQRR